MTKGTPKTKAKTKAARTGPVDETAAAYKIIEKDLGSVPKAQIGQVTADIPTAVSLALGALPGLEGLLPEMSDLLKKPPKAQIERLRERGLGLLYTHLQFVPRTSKKHEQDLEEARQLREKLLLAADAHVGYGHLDAEAVAKIREGAGLLDRAQDLIALSALFRAAWSEIADQTPVKVEQLERASALGTFLVAELGGKALGATGAGRSRKDWQDLRARAFRLFMTDYEEIQRAVEYVRYHDGDADVFAPSLHPRVRRSADVGDEGGGGSATEVVTGEDADA
jgi:hypothetical protein